MISKEKENSYHQRVCKKAGDTGSPEVQIAILTARIQGLPLICRRTRRIIIPEEVF